ncbi:Uncharacterised protein [uncultured archaeon]|nr:Uncharacterised protein [uncultured archaeon]
MAKKSGQKWVFNIRDNSTKSGAGGALYGIGFLGALYYFLTTATSLTMGVVGLIKAIFWPGVLVYMLLKSLGA